MFVCRQRLYIAICSNLLCKLKRTQFILFFIHSLILCTIFFMLGQTQLNSTQFSSDVHSPNQRKWRQKKLPDKLLFLLHISLFSSSSSSVHLLCVNETEHKINRKDNSICVKFVYLVDVTFLFRCSSPCYMYELISH